jgi:hypothetical protein
MIISHKHKYIFVELQRTASGAVRKELIDNYFGEEILNKNTGYHTFYKSAAPEEKKYFVFSGVRNPLDRTISFYEKLKNDPRSYISNIEYKKKKSLAEKYFLKQHKFIKESNATFSQYLKKFYYFPYDDRSCLSHYNFDYVYRFENLQNDFKEILSRLGITQVRPLPVVHKTKSKSSNISDYLDDEGKKHAIRIFGPFMEKWNYSMPFDEKILAVSVSDRYKFRFFFFLRYIYYRYLMER